MNLVAKNGDVLRGFEAQSHLRSADLDDYQPDVISDPDFLSDFSAEYQHASSLLSCLNKTGEGKLAGLHFVCNEADVWRARRRGVRRLWSFRGTFVWKQVDAGQVFETLVGRRVRNSPDSRVGKSGSTSRASSSSRSVVRSRSTARLSDTPYHRVRPLSLNVELVQSRRIPSTAYWLARRARLARPKWLLFRELRVVATATFPGVAPCLTDNGCTS